MIHLPSMPGYTTHISMDHVIESALTDLVTLQEAGFSGALVENDNDQPHTIGVTDKISSAFQMVMEEIIKKAKIPVGMEIIYDMEKTLRVAHAVKSPFIRLDVFVDSVETKWGIIKARSKELMEFKASLGANDLVVIADIQVKHAKMLENKLLEQSAKDAVDAGADALIVTGDWTGQPPTIADCKAVKEGASNTPVLIGSGFEADNARELLSIVDGAIVGTSIKTGQAVDPVKAKRLVTFVSSLL